MYCVDEKYMDAEKTLVYELAIRFSAILRIGILKRIIVRHCCRKIYYQAKNGTKFKSWQGCMGITPKTKISYAVKYVVIWTNKAENKVSF